MHLKVTIILLGSYIQETSQEIKYYQWIWQTTYMFSDFGHEAFKSTMASFRTISIDCINQEAHQRIDNGILISDLKATQDTHVDPNISFFTHFDNSYYCNFYHDIH